MRLDSTSLLLRGIQLNQLIGHELAESDVAASSEDLEVEEDAYAELVEYIRVGAQLIYMELHPRMNAVASSKTMH